MDIADAQQNAAGGTALPPEGGAERELALAALVEACSWPDTDYELARKSYADNLKGFA